MFVQLYLMLFGIGNIHGDHHNRKFWIFYMYKMNLDLKYGFLTNLKSISNKINLEIVSFKRSIASKTINKLNQKTPSWFKQVLLVLPSLIQLEHTLGDRIIWKCKDLEHWLVENLKGGCFNITFGNLKI